MSLNTIELTHAELENLIEALASKALAKSGQTSSQAQAGGAGAAARPAATSPAMTSSQEMPAEVRALARLFDHSLLRPETTRSQLVEMTETARRLQVGAVCISPTWIPLAAEKLRGSGVKVITVVGFPAGATLTSAKRAETESAILAGAEEIDMVMNIGAMKSGDFARVEEDIRGVVEVSKPAHALVKVILENGFLSNEEKVRACQLAKAAGADFVKTATGFGPSGATVEDIRLMRETVGPEMGVKAAGGVRSLKAVLAMLEAGATRLGMTASVAVLEEATALFRAK